MATIITTLVRGIVLWSRRSTSTACRIPRIFLYGDFHPVLLMSHTYGDALQVDTPFRQPQPQPQDPYKYDYPFQHQQSFGPPTGYRGNVKELVKYANAKMTARPSTPPAPTEIPVSAICLHVRQLCFSQPRDGNFHFFFGMCHTDQGCLIG